MTKKEQKKAGIGNGLMYILEVIELVRRQGISKNQAAGEIAKKYKVDKCTIIDKIQRRIELNAEQVEKYLKEPKLYNMRKVLNKRYPDKEDYINKIIDELVIPPEKKVKMNAPETPGQEINE